MEAQIITIFCVIDDILKCIDFRDDVQVTMTTSEIMTIAVAAGKFFGGNQARTCRFFKEQRYVKNMLSSSQFNRRLHAIDVSIWETINFVLSQIFISRNETQEYSVDSFPVEVCHNIRISRCKIYKDEEYRGYCASKREYFFGIRVHMVSTITRAPIEFIFAPGSHHDSAVFKQFQLDLPENSTLYSDSGNTDYNYEDILRDAGINFLPARKSNSKRPHSPVLAYLINHFRKPIETTFSSITSLFPRKIHAVTSRGFELKVFTFILAYSFTFL